MPNLTSYHAPAIHLNRELPKGYCDLIQHEIDYKNFLQTRIVKIQSSLSLTNKKSLPQRRYFNPNKHSSDIYQHNLHLCKKILQIWTNNSKQNRSVDCHNENYKKQINISHFRLRQKQWKEKIEYENKRFIHSLLYHRKKYRPIHDRKTAQESYKKHLKYLQTMSQYPKYVLINSVYKNLFKHYLPEYIYYNYTQFYNRSPNIPLHTQCRTVSFSHQIKKEKSPRINTNNKPSYIENLLQQVINDAIVIYNQPLPSLPASDRMKSSYSVWLKQDLNHQQKPFRSISCRHLLESSQKEVLKQSRSFDSYNSISIE